MTRPYYWNQPMRTLIPLLFASLVIHSTASAQSQDEGMEEPLRWYQIEVLFFRNLAESAQTEESWPMEIELQMPETSYLMPETDSPLADQAQRPWHPPQITLVEELEETVAGEEEREGSDTPPRLVYRGVADGETHLDAIRQKLQRRGDFHVLDYRAWRQPLLEDGAPVYFRVAAGEHHGLYRELEGYIGFSLKRYLHIDTDLWWGDYVFDELAPGDPDTAGTPEDAGTPPVIEAVADTEQGAQRGSVATDIFGPRPALRAAHLKEQRRMRSDEVHYFDHPLFGILVLISPWEHPEQVEP